MNVEEKADKWKIGNYDGGKLKNAGRNYEMKSFRDKRTLKKKQEKKAGCGGNEMDVWSHQAGQNKE